jgi:enamine deaminase RidA (YjgF/YER057c/UK114 family)
MTRTASHTLVRGGIVYVPPQAPLILSVELAPQVAVRKQTEQVLLHVMTLLTWAGSSLSQVLDVTVYIADSGLIDDLDPAYAGIFGNHAPPRRVIEKRALPPGVLVEIAVSAAVTNDRN